MTPLSDGSEEQPRQTESAFTNKLVMTLVVAAILAYGAFQQATLSDTVKRVTALETAFAALQASNVEQHRAMLDGIQRIERGLDTPGRQ
jgi:cell division protein FtsB